MSPFSSHKAAFHAAWVDPAVSAGPYEIQSQHSGHVFKPSHHYYRHHHNLHRRTKLSPHSTSMAHEVERLYTLQFMGNQWEQVNRNRFLQTESNIWSASWFVTSECVAAGLVHIDRAKLSDVGSREHQSAPNSVKMRVTCIATATKSPWWFSASSIPTKRSFPVGCVSLTLVCPNLQSANSKRRSGYGFTITISPTSRWSSEITRKLLPNYTNWLALI